MPAEIIKFPAVSGYLYLNSRDMAELGRLVHLLPGTWIIDPSLNGDHSRLWLRPLGAIVKGSPAFGFVRRGDLVWLVTRRDGPPGPNSESEVPFASIEAAMIILTGAIVAAQANWWPPDPFAA